MEHVGDFKVPTDSLIKLLIESLFPLIGLGRAYELSESAHVLLDYIHDFSLLLFERLEGRVYLFELLYVFFKGSALFGLSGMYSDEILNGIEILTFLQCLLENAGALRLNHIELLKGALDGENGRVAADVSRVS